jgi:trehalose 6-phosphate phosphatase
VPLAIGDDVTDEDMFRTALGLGGHAVLVDGSSHESVATARLADPAAVVALLVALADDVRRG